MSEDQLKVIAFYLPQFSPSIDNDRWWGRGFTEWTNVARARPLFPGHEQPRLPADLGFYDLRIPEVWEAQADLARSHEIDGFCLYHYWSLGRRLLSRLLDDWLATGRPDFPFCLTWANHNWGRRWDGGAEELLMRQQYSEDDDRRHIAWLCTVFRDPRYIRVDGKPLLLIHWAHELPDAARTIAIWRDEAARLGVGDLYIVRSEAHERLRNVDPRADGFDASAQWQPEGACVGQRLTEPAQLGLEPWLDLPGLRENDIFNYEHLAYNAAHASRDYPTHPVVVPSWDNTARRPAGGAHLYVGSTPSRYREWVEAAAAQQAGSDPALLFVNAWNEWAESAALEPDMRHGLRYLQAHLGIHELHRQARMATA